MLKNKLFIVFILGLVFVIGLCIVIVFVGFPKTITTVETKTGETFKGRWINDGSFFSKDVELVVDKKIIRVPRENVKYISSAAEK